jgi:ribose transport system substrate-binding protein
MMMQIESYRARKMLLPVIVALAATTALALGGCASAGGNAAAGSASDGGEVRVVYIGSKATTFAQAIHEGLDSVDGITADFIEVGFDEAKQAQALDDAVASGKYKAIVAIPSSSTALVPSVKRAIEAGVQFVNVEGHFGPDPKSVAVQLPGQTASIVTDYREQGKLMFETGLKYCEEKGIKVCNMVRIDGLPQYATADLFAEADKAATEAAGDKANVYPTVFTGGYDTALGLKAGQDLLTAHPDVNVIFGQAPGVLGVMQAAANVGKDKTIGFVTQNADVTSIKSVKDGTSYASIALFPKTGGELAGQAILRHIADPSLEGETINPVPDGADLVITKENVDSFTPQF